MLAHGPITKKLWSIDFETAVMKCVGAHGDPNAMFQDGDSVKCNV